MNIRSGKGSKPRHGSQAVHCGYADTAWGQVHYRVVAGCAPAVVFLHQTASSSASFRFLLESLRLPNRLIALDTPGFGGSFDPPGWPSVGRYAAYAMAALDAMRVGRFHVFGHHTGANVAGEIALRYPRRVRSVTMLGPVPMDATERRAFRRALDQPIRPRADGGHLLQNWAYAFDHNPGCDPALLHGEVTSMLRAWRARPQAYRAVSFHDCPSVIRRIRVPLLLMSAPGDYFHSRFAEVCALRPDAATAIVQGDNFQPLRDPQGVARALERFLWNARLRGGSARAALRVLPDARRSSR